MTRFCPSDSSLCAEPSAEFRPINVKKNQRRITEKKSGICPTNADDAIGCQSCSTVGDFFEKTYLFQINILKSIKISNISFCAKKRLISRSKKCWSKKVLCKRNICKCGFGYRLFFLRSIAQFLARIYINCFVSS